MRLNLLLQFFLSLIYFVSVFDCRADVWKCGNVYTNVPSKHSNCQTVEGSLVCGSAGNKYYSPKRLSGSAVGPCEVSVDSRSPIVDLESAKISAKRHREEVAMSK